MTTLLLDTALLLPPLLFILWLTESCHARIQRLRRKGAARKTIGERYGVSDKTAKRYP